MKCKNDGTIARINAVLGLPPESFTMAVNSDYDDIGFTFMICQPVPPTATIPEEFTRFTVPSFAWAVFPEPERNMDRLWTRINTEWPTMAEYEYIEGPAVEAHYGHGEYGVGEIWITVKKK